MSHVGRDGGNGETTRPKIARTIYAHPTDCKGNQAGQNGLFVGLWT